MLAIEGMTCASCVANIEKVLAGVAGIVSCAVNLMTGLYAIDMIV
jgi:copper chaperone CopZ